MTSLIDIPATILAAADINIPAEFRGRPLQGLVDRSACESWPDHVFIQISETHTGRAVRTSRWKYEIGYGPDDEPVYRELFLYDLDADPFERNNLVGDPAYTDVRLDLLQKIRLRMEACGEDLGTIRL